MKSAILYSVVLSVAGGVASFASEPMEDFESLLQSVSDIATKSSLNVDYMPSVVTVIEAESFRDAGIQNLGEALSMLPGIQIQISPMGYSMTTVRGFKNPNAYLSDKMKILVDGVAIHNEIAGSSHFYMDFPLHLVEKIELLRGPGSTLYGAGSFYATINVITKMGKDSPENRFGMGLGSYEYLTTGANVHTQMDGWHLYADGYYQRNDKQLFSVQSGAWDSPRYGHSDERLQDYSIGLKAKRGGLKFLSRYKRNVSGNYYSFEGKFNPIGDEGGEHINTYLLTQLSYKLPVGEAEVEVKTGLSHRQLDVRANIYNVEQTADKFATVGIDMQEGFVYHEKTHEQNYEAEVTAALPEFHGNDLLLGAGVRHAHVTLDDFYNSVDNAIILNMDVILESENYDDFRYKEERESAFWANPTRKLLKNGVSRTISYAYLQDLIALTDRMDVVLGVRFDHYSDFGSNWNRRAAIVYRAKEELIFKLLYGSAFRAPTFIEAYQNGHVNFRAGDENIHPEETDTYEFVTIFTPDDHNRFLVNLFYSELRNVIDLEEYPYTDPGYRNYKKRSSKGVELEYYYRTPMRHNLYFNASYIDAEYMIPPEEGEIPLKQSMPDISKVMLKAMYVYRPDKKFSVAATWRYYSETTSTELKWVKNAGIDPTVDSYHLIDTALRYRFTPMSDLRFSIKNLFDADVYHPSYYYLTDGGVKRDGMHFYLTFDQKF